MAKILQKCVDRECQYRDCVPYYSACCHELPPGSCGGHCEECRFAYCAECYRIGDEKSGMNKRKGLNDNEN